MALRRIRISNKYGNPACSDFRSSVVIFPSTCSRLLLRLVIISHCTSFSQSRYPSSHKILKFTCTQCTRPTYQMNRRQSWPPVSLPPSPLRRAILFLPLTTNQLTYRCEFIEKCWNTWIHLYVLFLLSCQNLGKKQSFHRPLMIFEIFHAQAYALMVLEHSFYLGKALLPDSNT